MTPLGIDKHSHILSLADCHTCLHSSSHVVHLDNHCLTAHASTLRRVSQAQHLGASCIRHTSQAFYLCAGSGELADLLDMLVPDLALKLIPAALPKFTEDPCIGHTSQTFCLFADPGELADLLEMPVPDLALKLIPAALPKLTEDPCIRHTSQTFCLFADPGELADLLEMPVPELALRLIPAALPKLTEDQNTAALEALAHSVGYGLQQMMLDYGFHVVAKYLYGGWST